MKPKSIRTEHGLKIGETEFTYLHGDEKGLSLELSTPWLVEHGGGALTIRVTPKGRVRIWNHKLELKK